MVWFGLEKSLLSLVALSVGPVKRLPPAQKGGVIFKTGHFPCYANLFQNPNSKISILMLLFSWVQGLRKLTVTLKNQQQIKEFLLKLGQGECSLV